MNQLLIVIFVSYYFYIVGVGLYIFLRRKKAVQKKEINFSHFKSYTGETTEELAVLQNHFNNQFQIPIVFMIACLLSLQLNSTNAFTVIFAFLFFISRMAHTYVHLGSNNVLNRAECFFFGVFMVIFIFLQALTHIFYLP